VRELLLDALSCLATRNLVGCYRALKALQAMIDRVKAGQGAELEAAFEARPELGELEEDEPYIWDQPCEDSEVPLRRYTLGGF